MRDPQTMGAWATVAAGDAVSQGVAAILLMMSVVSWYYILSRSWFTWQASRGLGPALAQYWQDPDSAQALDRLRSTDRSGLLMPLVEGALQHPGERERQRALREALGSSRRELQRGLTWLASVASTAPFVGLLGTVWGIYHALLEITASGQASIENVAGPVGEALIMTAAGLAVAIPALLGYNALVRTQREILLRLDGFAHDLQARAERPS
jgi:biopolymer transport protein ExbB